MDWRADYARLRPQIQDGLGDEGFSIDWLEDRLNSGRAQLWIGEKAALVTEINAWVVVAAGDKREIIETLRPQAEAWCASRGASAAIVDGRKGWNRALSPHGYYPFNAGARKDL
jgi:hypothetical protein